jgi:hypothetical protein
MWLLADLGADIFDSFDLREGLWDVLIGSMIDRVQDSGNEVGSQGLELRLERKRTSDGISEGGLEM